MEQGVHLNPIELVIVQQRTEYRAGELLRQVHIALLSVTESDVQTMAGEGFCFGNMQDYTAPRGAGAPLSSPSVLKSSSISGQWMP